MNYLDTVLLGKLLKRIMELNLRYYIGADGTILTSWKGGWEAYHIVAQTDKRMEITA